MRRFIPSVGTNQSHSAWAGRPIVNNQSLTSRLQNIYMTCSAPRAADLISLYSNYLVYAVLYSPSRFWAMKEIYRRMRDFVSSPRKGSIEALIRGQSSRAPAMTDSQLEALYKQEFASPHCAQASSPANKPGRSSPQSNGGGCSLNSRTGIRPPNTYEVSCRYRQRLTQIGYSCWEPEAHLDPVYYKYPVLYEPDRKTHIISKARREGIELSDMFGSPLFPVERAMQWRALGYQRGMCPVAEDVSARIIALPVHGRVHISQIDRTVSLLASVTD